MTLSLVSTVTVGSGGAASIEWTGIPQTATDLLVVLSARVTAAVTNDNIGLQFNGDTTAANYTYRWLYGTGTGVGSGTGTLSGILGLNATGASSTASTFGNGMTYLPNYSGSNTKSASCDTVNENNASAANAFINAGLWNSTAAITSIKLISTSARTLDQYTTASLYTITKGSGGATVA